MGGCHPGGCFQQPPTFLNLSAADADQAQEPAPAEAPGQIGAPETVASTYLADNKQCIKQQCGALQTQLFTCQQKIMDGTGTPADHARCQEIEQEMETLEAMRHTIGAAEKLHMPDSRFSVFPGAVPLRVIRRLSAVFLERTKLLNAGGK